MGEHDEEASGKGKALRYGSAALVVAALPIFISIFPLKADVLSKDESREQRAELVARIDKVEIKLDKHLAEDATDKAVMKDNLYNICLAVAKRPAEQCKR